MLTCHGLNTFLELLAKQTLFKRFSESLDHCSRALKVKSLHLTNVHLPNHNDIETTYYCNLVPFLHSNIQQVEMVLLDLCIIIIIIMGSAYVFLLAEHNKHLGGSTRALLDLLLTMLL